MPYSHIGGDPRESFKDQQDTFNLNLVGVRISDRVS